MLTCSIRPQRHLGPRRSDDVPQGLSKASLAGHVKVLVGGKNVKLDNSYVHNLIHGLHPGRRAPGARRDRTRAGVLHQRRRADQHVRVLSAGRGGVRAAVAEVPGTRARLVWVRDDGVAVVSTSGSACQAATGTACRGTAFTSTTTSSIAKAQRRSWLPTVVHHRAGDGRVRSVLRRSLPPDEGGVVAASRQHDHGRARKGLARHQGRGTAFLKEIGAVGNPTGSDEACRHLFGALRHCHGFSHFRE